MSTEIYKQQHYYSEQGYTQTYHASFDDFKPNETNTNFSKNYNCLFPSFFVNFSRNSGSSFQIELNYKYLKYSLLNFSRIEIPVIYNYNYLHYKKVSPFINIGFTYVFDVGTHIKGMYYKYDKLEGATFEENHFNPVYSTQTEYLNKRFPEIDGYKFTLNAGFGVKYMLPDKNALKLEFRIHSYIIPNEFDIVLDGGAIYKARISSSNLSILLSYIFK